MRFNRILRCINPTIQPILIKHNKNCIKCKHFLLSNDICQKFKQQQYITGEINDVSAEMCRKDETKCGFQASFYNEINEEEQKNREQELQKEIQNLTNKQITFVFCNFILPVGIVTIVVMTFILPVGIFTIVVMTFNNVFY